MRTLIRNDFQIQGRKGNGGQNGENEINFHLTFETN